MKIARTVSVTPYASTRVSTRHNAFQDTSDLATYDRVELIRTVLRQQRVDSRLETMNTIAWMSQSLATVAAALAVLFVVLVVIDGDGQRLLPVAAGMAVIAAAFAGRAYG